MTEQVTSDPEVFVPRRTVAAVGSLSTPTRIRFEWSTAQQVSTS